MWRTQRIQQAGRIWTAVLYARCDRGHGAEVSATDRSLQDVNRLADDARLKPGAQRRFHFEATSFNSSRLPSALAALATVSS